MTKSKTPFEELAKLRDSLPPGPTRAPAATPRGPARAVVRLERKGRRGKEATVIVKQALGCGGTVEGDTIVLQGDLRQRLAPVLEQRGVGRVTIG
jgi:translation initiation factor 1